ncbi:hypothetical protein niasHT_003405 [Heterodera trifolii]|uniref:Polymerase nucleotidyl transferase domain-containing protein n=1 Tax=Heterodera trifolii TaxID=157864 RepID=A0ABD2LNS1_9BILA
MFGLNTTDSDIDLICVVPGNVIKREHFLGEQNEICVEKKCQNGEDDEKQNLTASNAFYCHLCETRIRLQLEFDINNRGMTTNWHIYPALFQETCQITQKLEEIPAKNHFDYYHCKVWLIGTDQQLLNSNEKRLINGKLLNFDWAIKRDFLKFNGKLSNKSGGDDH